MPIEYSADDDLLACLDFQPIDDLITAAREGFRLYELFRLAGPDELIHYVDVVVESDQPERYLWWSQDFHAQTGASRLRGPMLHPLLIPTPPAEVIEAARKQSGQRWPDIEAARAEARASSDRLIVHELALMGADEHPNDLGLRESNISPYLERHFRFVPRRHYSDSAYQLIAELLAHPAIAAFTHRGRGDWPAIKLACAEQARRCGAIPQGESELFPVRVLTSWSGGSCFDWDDGDRVSLDPFPAWSRGVRFQFEGLQMEGLFLDEGGFGGQLFATDEREYLRKRVAVVLTDYEGEDKSPLRQWYRHASGLYVGLKPVLVEVLAPVLASHALNSG